jgi:undecaprenyl-diphosphatase
MKTWARMLATGGRAMRRELVALSLLAGATAGVWGFVGVADEIHDGELERFDRTVLTAMRDPDDPGDPVGPEWFEEMVRDVTALGGTAILAGLSLAVVGYLAIDRKRHAAVLVAVAVTGGWALSSALKLGFGRARPDLVPHRVVVYSASFPSGHSMLSAVVFLTLGALLARLHGSRAIKAYVLTLAVVTTLVVGLSRIYLGVHWPSDVLAGWAAGSAWALACWLVALLLQRRGKVESEPDQGPAS